jgi:hypothetical protein
MGVGCKARVLEAEGRGTEGTGASVEEDRG